MSTDRTKHDAGPSGTAEPGALGPPLGGALGIVMLVAILYLVGGFPLQLLLGEGGLLLSQIFFLALPPIVYVVMRGYDPGRTFSLRMPTGVQLAAGLLLLAGGIQIAWFLAWLQSLFVPVPVEYLEAMAEVLTADSLPRFLWLLILVAVVPAFSEEVLFRGVLLSGLRSRLPALLAVIACGVVFGLFHVAPQTGFRILPTAWLGMVLAWVVVSSGSLPLAMVLHFVNNGTLLALAALPRTREMVTGTEDAPPLLLLPLALVLFAAGLRLMARAASPGAGFEQRMP